MAKNFDFLGSNKQQFLKQSFQVFNNLTTTGSMQFVGKTQNEITLNGNIENVEWFDNSGATQVLFALDIDKVDPTLNFSFMQVADNNALALAFNADMDSSDPNVFRNYLGSNPDEYSEAEWRFVGSSVGNLTLTIVYRRAIAFANGDITFGSPGSYSEVPVTIRALQDTSITNDKRDLVYWELTKPVTS